ncbi:MAG TPA: hypothetical protein VGP12_05010, partial [Nitrosospira sp.]|nr:hypothetical protein [Nitrosospira sp.]
EIGFEEAWMRIMHRSCNPGGDRWMLTGYRSMVNSSPCIHAQEHGACYPANKSRFGYLLFRTSGKESVGYRAKALARRLQ